MNINLEQALTEGMKAFFLLMVPFSVAILVGAFLSSLLQIFMQINDTSLAYALKLISLVCVLIFFFSAISGTLINLAETIYR